MRTIVRARGRGVAWAAALACALASTGAKADPSTADRALAESLFVAARELMKAGRYAEACPKLEESQRLDPGGGTLLNLGLCHEGIGRTASAWIELTEAARSAHAENKADRERIARDHLATVAPRVPRFAIVVGPNADLPGLDVELDGAPHRRAAWGVPAPLDPGAHVVVATAPGHVRFEAKVDLPADGGTRSLTIPALAVASTGSPPTVEALRPAAAIEAPAAAPSSPLRVTGFALGGAGLVALGFGSYFGVQAIAKRQDSDEQCPGGRCTSLGVNLNDDAKHAALTSDLLIGGAVALVGAGVTLVIIARSRPAATAGTLFVAPATGPHLAGVTFGGAL